MNRQRIANLYRPRLDHLENRVVPAPVTFQMRPQFSSITLDPIIHVGTSDFQIVEQAPGSLTTGFVGRNQGDLDLTALTIQFFDAGSNIFARNSGNWAPDVCGVPGNAPANFGGKFSFFGDNLLALRNVRITLSSGPIALTVVDSDDWSFPATVDYNQNGGDLDTLTVSGPSCDPISGTEANASSALGNLHDNGNGSYNITVPIDLVANTVVDATTSFDTHITGTLGGILPPAPAPMPSPGRRLDSAVAQSLSDDTRAPVAADGLADPLRPSAVHTPTVQTVVQTVDVVSGISFTRPSGKVHVAQVFETILDGPLSAD